jgi:hypothetical protein
VLPTVALITGDRANAESDSGSALAQLFGLGNLKPIAGSANGLQVAGILRIDLNLLTDAANINIH